MLAAEPFLKRGPENSGICNLSSPWQQDDIGIGIGNDTDSDIASEFLDQFLVFESLQQGDDLEENDDDASHGSSGLTGSSSATATSTSPSSYAAAAAAAPDAAADAAVIDPSLSLSISSDHIYDSPVRKTPRHVNVHVDDAFGLEHYAPAPSFGGGAFISDSELLRLEGISLDSPIRPGHSHVAPTPSPPHHHLAQNHPSTAPKTSNRFFDAISSTLRRATAVRKARSTRPPPPALQVHLTPREASEQQQQQQQQQGLPVQIQPQSRGHSHGQFDAKAFKVRGPDKTRAQQQQTKSAQRQGRRTTFTQALSQYDDGSGIGFVKGFVEDPFYEAISFDPYVQQQHLQQQPRRSQYGPHDAIPLRTAISHDSFNYQAAILSDSAWPPSPTTGIDPAMLHSPGAPPSTAAFIPEDHVAMLGSYEHGGWYLHDGGGGDGSSVDHHAGLDIAMLQHQQQQQHSAAWGPSGLETPGLTIHMPKPRSSQPTIVHNLTCSAAAAAYAVSPPPPAPPHSERRPRPRAPSSGARHHHNHPHGHAHTPLRKTRLRSASASPTPAPGGHVSGGTSTTVTPSGHGHGSYASGSVRKRRSLSRSRSSTGLNGCGGGGGGIEIGFVNYTPSDAGTLMMGVAPSGSAKTKARREKEAEERRRKLSQAAVKLVRAAGGDVDKLVEEGFTI